MTRLGRIPQSLQSGFILLKNKLRIKEEEYLQYLTKKKDCFVASFEVNPNSGGFWM